MMSKRKSYDLTFKLRAVSYADNFTKAAAAREFGVDPKRIRAWCNQKDVLMELKTGGSSKRKRLQGAGRKALDGEMEEALFDWIIELRGRNLRVSRAMICVQARALSGNADFKASRGWLDRFMKRHSLSLRRKTTVCQKVPADCIPKLVSFIRHLRTLQNCNKYQHHCIFAMDKTACWMDMPSDTTVATTGARSVPLKTTGHEKDHFSVVLTARADGMKMKPFIVFKGKGTRLIKDLQLIPGVVVRFSANGWLNDSVTIDYLRTVIGTLTSVNISLCGMRIVATPMKRFVLRQLDCGFTQLLFLEGAPNSSRQLTWCGMLVLKPTSEATMTLGLQIYHVMSIPEGET